jgi:hypothetical protein
VKAILKDPRSKGTVPSSVSREVMNTLLQGIQYLSDWTSKVLQQTAWKYAHPVITPPNNIIIDNDYERVPLRHIYTYILFFRLFDTIINLKKKLL